MRTSSTRSSGDFSEQRELTGEDVKHPWLLLRNKLVLVVAASRRLRVPNRRWTGPSTRRTLT